MHSEREALIRAVVQAPDDDAPRLIFADWCDENGDPERGEFIRAQIELERSKVRSRRCEIEKRLDELSEVQDRWTDEFDNVVLPTSANPCHFHRGFVEGLELTASRFVEHAYWLIDSTPLSQLRLPHRPDVEALLACDSLHRIRSIEFDLDPPCEPGHLLAVLASKQLKNVRSLAFIQDRDRRYDGLPRCPDDTVNTLASNQNLTKLTRLRFANILWLGFGGLFQAPWTPQITELEVSGCGLHFDDAESLDCFSEFPLLRVLRLTDNAIGNNGLKAFAEAKSLNGLELLDLRSIYHQMPPESWGNEFDGDEDPPTPETFRLLKVRFGGRLRI